MPPPPSSGNLTPQQAKALIASKLGSLGRGPGKAGFAVDVAGEYVILTYYSESGRRRNAPTAKMQALQKLLTKEFPKLDEDLFYGYCETVRRKQGLASRWKSIQNAQKANKNSIIGFEILDADPARRAPLPANPRDIGHKAARELPRIYTWIRAVGSGSTIEHFRTLIFTEHQFNKIRPDEIIVTYKVQQPELDFIKTANGSFRNLPKAARVAVDIKIHVGDINQQITGAALQEHFEKTMRGLEAVLTYLVGPPGAGGLDYKLVGQVVCTSTDSLLRPGAVRLDLGSMTMSNLRQTEAGTALRMQVTFEVDGLQISQVASTDQLLPELPVQGSRDISERLLVDDIAPAARKVSDAIYALLVKYAKP